MLNSSKELINQDINFKYSCQITNALQLLGRVSRTAKSAAQSYELHTRGKKLQCDEQLFSSKDMSYDPVFNFAGDAL